MSSPALQQNVIDSEDQNGYTWFKFYFYDWLTDPDVMGMSAAEEGIYIRLLAIQARDGYLPADLHLCARLCKDARTCTKWLQKYARLFPLCANKRKRANVKLLNLAIKSGKLRSSENTDKKRIELDEDGESYGLSNIANPAVRGFEVEEE
jgi:hypothetical protein